MEHPPSPGAWPLSAAATALLRDPRTAPNLLLRLGLRELVVRGAVRVAVVERRLRRPKVLLSPGSTAPDSLPGPLLLLAQALSRHLGQAGTPAGAAVQKASGWRQDLATRVRDAARQELAAAGLLRAERTRLLGVVPRTRWQLTPSGRAWASSAAAAAGSAVLPAAGLLLALDEQVQRRLRDTLVEVPSAWGELDGLDAVLGDAGPGLDAAADGGSGSGDGGDGGGGD